MDERRRFSRSPAKEKAFLKSRENSPHEGLLMDVSSGGMRILSNANIKIGTALTGQFKIMPNLGNFYVSAEVVWSKPLKPEGDGLPSDRQSHKPEGDGLASLGQSHRQSQDFEVGIKFNKVSTIPVE